MFDRISHRYDLLNRLLSFRQDVIWRKKMLKMIPHNDALSVLDLATGTADVIINIAENRKADKLIGIDPAQNMLKYGREKVKALSLPIHLIPGDGHYLPLKPDQFDATTISFGIRNLHDPLIGLQEMKRVLKSGGQAFILEFSLPKNRFIKTGYLFYFRYILPFIGGIISGDKNAYKYLNESVEDFVYGNAFCDLMKTAGFKDVKARELTLGIATIYTGQA